MLGSEGEPIQEAAGEVMALGERQWACRRGSEIRRHLQPSSSIQCVYIAAQVPALGSLWLGTSREELNGFVRPFAGVNPAPKVPQGQLELSSEI